MNRHATLLTSLDLAAFFTNRSCDRMADIAADANKKKYDRQLRIWGAHGQASLESARVCLLNAGPTGSETLKNLVLGGIAAFTIVDDCKVEASDLGNNFLLEESNLGTGRARGVTELLKELNDSVSGSFVEDSAEELLESNPSFFQNFQLVVASQGLCDVQPGMQLRETTAVKLDEACREMGVRLILVRSYGLVGSMRASLVEHRVVESKPDNMVEDLRFHQPWPALRQWADSIDLASLDDAEHAHVPYAALLIKAVSHWYQDHGPKLPANAKEKAAFKELLKSWQHSIDGIPVDEQNFVEAIENARKLFSPPSIPSEVRTIMEDPAAEPSSSSDDFWLLVAALKRFVASEGNGSLPLEGSIPDMTATTAMYLELQRIYRARAEQDVAAMEGHLRTIERSLGRPAPGISHATVRTFAKNARNLRVARWRPLAEEAKAEGQLSEAMKQALAGEDTAANAGLYLLLRSVDRFHSTYNRFPGSFDSGVEEDVALLKSVAAGLAAEYGLSGSAVADDLVGEMTRFGAGELHTVAAIMGGIAAQEAIKLLTAQFVPLKGTLIYNAMASTSSVLLP